MSVSGQIRLPVVLLALLTGACSQATTPGPQTAAPPASAATAELEALYRARLDSTRTRFNEADVKFMNGMIHHHAQALEMAAKAPTHGAGPSIRILAARIINAQKDEIARMQQWLRERDQAVPEVHTMDGRVLVHGADHAAHMPGMLTAEQMRELEAARGTGFDRLFLTYMIQHHRGAVTMVHELFSTHGAGQDDEIFKLASDVQADQDTEIARMELMLSELPPGDR